MINEITNFIKEQIQTNQFFSTAFFVSVAGTVGFYLKDVPVKLWQLIKRRFVFTATIYDNDQIFYDFEAWFYKNHNETYRSVEASVSETFNFSNSGLPTERDNKTAEVFYKHNTGIYLIKYKGKYIYIDKTKDKLEKAVDIKNIFLNQYTLTSWFGKSAVMGLLKQAVDERVKLASEKDVAVYAHDAWGHWSYCNNISTKSIDGVIIDKSIKEKLLSDLDEFTNSEDWYNNASIMYKRGYSFTGKPGNGKTSLCMALARYTRKNLYTMDLSNFKDNEGLKESFRKLPNDCILLIEDIDASFKKREALGESKLTFSCLLNCMDGVSYKHGLITFVTTNHPENLDPALYRKGRIDFDVEIKNPNKELVEEYIKRFYGETVLLDNYTKDIAMCEVQDVCVRNRESIKGCIKELTESSTLRAVS